MGQHPAGYRHALRDVTVRRLWAATAVSVAGDYVAAGALMILAFERTGLVVGPAAVFAIQALPALLSGALAGRWLDQVPRVRALVGLQLAGAVSVSLPVVAGLAWEGAGEGILPVLAAAALLGAVRAGSVSVRSAAVAEGVPDELRGPLLGLMNTTEQSAQVVGYLAGTALAYGIGAEVALLADAASFVVASVVLSRLVLPEAAARERRPRLSAGVRDIMADPVLRLLAPLVVVTASVAALPEALAAAVAPSGHRWAPFVFAAGPLGQATAMFLMGRDERIARPSFQLTQLAWLALGLAIASLGRTAAWFVVANFLVGTGVAWSLGPQLTFLRRAPTARMAQITGTMIAVLIAAEGLGTPLFAVIADRAGVGAAYRLAGVLVLTSAVVGWAIKERTPAAVALDEAQ